MNLFFSSCLLQILKHKMRTCILSDVKRKVFSTTSTHNILKQHSYNKILDKGAFCTRSLRDTKPNILHRGAARRRTTAGVSQMLGALDVEGPRRAKSRRRCGRHREDVSPANQRYYRGSRRRVVGRTSQSRQEAHYRAGGGGRCANSMPKQDVLRCRG